MQEYVCADGRMSINGICSVVNQNNDNNNIIPTKDYSKDVKSSFEWDFDKVGNKIGNFGDTVKGNINAYNDYIEDNLGIPKGVSYGARAVGVGMGVSSYGLIGAALPFTIPFLAGGALNAKQKKENERITQATMKDPQGDIQTINLQKAATGSSYSTGGIGTSAGASRDPAGTGGGSQQATSSGATNTGRTDGGWGW